MKSDRSGASNATPRRSSRKGSRDETPTRKAKDVASPKRSVRSDRSNKAASPQNNANRPETIDISAMMTADGASALEASMMAGEFDRREFNEIDILGSLNRDNKGNVLVPIDSKS